MNLTLKLKKWFLTFVSKLYVHKFPFFIIYDPEMHKLKGHEIREILDVLKPGDILFRRYDGYITSILTPGYWSHAGLYVGDNKVVHAIGAGVVEEDILDFCRTDSVGVCRFKNVNQDIVENAIDTSYDMIEDHIGYDYAFAANNNAVYCTEMVNICYTEAFSEDYDESLGTYVLTPDHLFISDKLYPIITVKH